MKFVKLPDGKNCSRSIVMTNIQYIISCIFLAFLCFLIAIAFAIGFPFLFYYSPRGLIFIKTNDDCASDRNLVEYRVIQGHFRTCKKLATIDDQVHSK